MGRQQPAQRPAEPEGPDALTAPRAPEISAVFYLPRVMSTDVRVVYQETGLAAYDGVDAV